MHDSGSVLIPIPIPGLLWKLDSDSDSDSKCLILVPILIPVKSGMIPKSILIPESESCITGLGHLIQYKYTWNQTNHKE